MASEKVWQDFVRKGEMHKAIGEYMLQHTCSLVIATQRVNQYKDERKMSYKISDLDKAIETVLGAEIVKQLKTHGATTRTRLLDLAIIAAFIDKRTDLTADILRYGYQKLSEHGFFPAEMWDKED